MISSPVICFCITTLVYMSLCWGCSLDFQAAAALFLIKTAMLLQVTVEFGDKLGELLDTVRGAASGASAQHLQQLAM